MHRRDPRVLPLLEEILAGAHEVSVDPIVEAEFFAAPIVPRRKEAAYEAVLSIGVALPLTSNAARLAASWLARMDPPQRRAHFADALIAGMASVHSARLVTADRVLRRVFPVAVLEY
jgi:predicted nucleic acid-binding protein